ncbi:translation initiation factor IF-2-like isoform X1 [Camelus ferus]|uniref:Translation initiation factor IF-2-like isoform X1 n=1 Tax=Camelus ferus TaxID=419612 RepID=A0A8B8S4K3_CAMFR|nr:translation initiation factor IF-2-like isoform X1 [Camelus ferus]
MAARSLAVVPQASRALGAAPTPNNASASFGLGLGRARPLKNNNNKTPRAPDPLGSRQVRPGPARRARARPRARGPPPAPRPAPQGARARTRAPRSRRPRGGGAGARGRETWLLVLFRRRGVATSPRIRAGRGSEGWTNSAGLFVRMWRSSAAEEAGQQVQRPWQKHLQMPQLSGEKITRPPPAPTVGCATLPPICFRILPTQSILVLNDQKQDPRECSD